MEYDFLMQVMQRSKRNAEPKKAKKGAQTSISTNDEEMNNIVHSSSTCSSEEDGCSASQELNGASESTGKAKGSKNPATDSQSLYARVGKSFHHLHEILFFVSFFGRI